MSYEKMKARKNTIIADERKGLNETNLLTVLVELFPNYRKNLSQGEKAVVNQYPLLFTTERDEYDFERTKLSDAGRMIYKWAHDFAVKAAESEAQSQAAKSVNR